MYPYFSVPASTGNGRMEWLDVYSLFGTNVSQSSLGQYAQRSSNLSAESTNSHNATPQFPRGPPGPAQGAQQEPSPSGIGHESTARYNLDLPFRQHDAQAVPDHFPHPWMETFADKRNVLIDLSSDTVEHPPPAPGQYSLASISNIYSVPLYSTPSVASNSPMAALPARSLDPRTRSETTSLSIHEAVPSNVGCSVPPRPVGHSSPHRSPESSPGQRMSVFGSHLDDPSYDNDHLVSWGVEKDGMIWGMKVEDYRALSARERKRVRSRVSARSFRAKRKAHLTALETSVDERSLQLKLVEEGNARLRHEVTDLKQYLAKYEPT